MMTQQMSNAIDVIIDSLPRLAESLEGIDKSLRFVQQEKEKMDEFTYELMEQRAEMLDKIAALEAELDKYKYTE